MHHSVMIAFLLGSKVDLIAIMRALALVIWVLVSIACPRRRPSSSSSVRVVRVLLRHLMRC